MTKQHKSSQSTTPTSSHKAGNRQVQESSFAATHMRRRPILHLCPTLDPDDFVRETVDMAVMSQRAGWPTLIASSGGALVPDAERSAVQHRMVPLNKRRGMLNDWRIRMKLEAVIQRDRPNLIHAHGVETLPYAYAISRIHHLPIVIDILNPVTDISMFQRMIGSLGKIPYFIRVPTEYIGCHLYDDCGIPAERMHHIPTGVDLHWFSTGYVTPERLAILSRTWRLPEQGTIMLVPLPLSTGMGHETVLDALVRLKQDNVFAVLIGQDKNEPGRREEIEAMVHRLDLNGRVVMPEFCTDWPAAFWHASVVVLPNSTPRGDSRSLLAAQAMGRPVIVTDIGANRELVDSEAAWIIPPKDPVALAEALRQTIKLDINHRLALAERERDFIAVTFPHAAWLEDTLHVYDMLINPGVREARALHAVRVAA